MIIEAKPLHKKKKRLAKQRSIREIQTPHSLEVVRNKINSFNFVEILFLGCWFTNGTAQRNDTGV